MRTTAEFMPALAGSEACTPVSQFAFADADALDGCSAEV